MSFELHPRLAEDTLEVGELPLCRVLLMNDLTYPWCILVPRRAATREIHHLAAADQLQLLPEISGVAAAMESAFKADKMNIAALGNVVPQLHVHIIARFEADPVWPAPVWGKLPPRPYPLADRRQRIAKLHAAFESLKGFRASEHPLS